MGWNATSVPVLGTQAAHLTGFRQSQAQRWAIGVSGRMVFMLEKPISGPQAHLPWFQGHLGSISVLQFGESAVQSGAGRAKDSGARVTRVGFGWGGHAGDPLCENSRQSVGQTGVPFKKTWTGEKSVTKRRGLWNASNPFGGVSPKWRREIRSGEVWNEGQRPREADLGTSRRTICPTRL